MCMPKMEPNLESIIFMDIKLQIFYINCHHDNQCCFHYIFYNNHGVISTETEAWRTYYIIEARKNSGSAYTPLRPRLNTIYLVSDNYLQNTM